MQMNFNKNYIRRHISRKSCVVCVCVCVIFVPNYTCLTNGLANNLLRICGQTCKTLSIHTITQPQRVTEYQNSYWPQYHFKYTTDTCTASAGPVFYAHSVHGTMYILRLAACKWKLNVCAFDRSKR